MNDRRSTNDRRSVNDRQRANAIKALSAALLGGDDLGKALDDIAAGDGATFNPGVKRQGNSIILPEDADLSDVINDLDELRRNEEQVVEFVVDIPVSPWDGAHALKEALQRELGIVIHRGCAAGCCPPKQIDVEVDFGKTISIPWGRFSLPNMSGATITTATNTVEGRMVFQCRVACERRFERRLRRLLDKIREIATTESLHRGKAFTITFKDPVTGKPIEMASPKFFELSSNEPIFSRKLASSIERNIFTPIRNADQLSRAGKSLKRGVAFVGKYGVGKTLLASHVARIATKHGWTFIYVKDSTELPEALRFAQQFQPVVVFAEDVDRVAGTERTNEVNGLLNQLDGIDGKTAKIMTIVTSNHPDRINEAMRRPGRINLTLSVSPPDRETVGRMIRSFAGSTLDPKADLTKVTQILEGEIPARIREAVDRAELEGLRRTGEVDAKITAADLEETAQEVKDEAKAFEPEQGDESSPSSGHGVVADALSNAADSIRNPRTGNGHPAAARRETIGAR